jgi:ABC-type Mn2+/Zn2+ transport system permease subunit
MAVSHAVLGGVGCAVFAGTAGMWAVANVVGVFLNAQDNVENAETA